MNAFGTYIADRVSPYPAKCFILNQEFIRRLRRVTQTQKSDHE